jgi:hypothetical protein
MHRNDKSDDVIAVSQSPEQSEGGAWQSLLAKFQIPISKFQIQNRLVIWILVI